MLKKAINDHYFNYYHRPRRMDFETDEQIDKQMISNQKPKRKCSVSSCLKMHPVLAQVCRYAQSFHCYITCKCGT